MEIVGGGIGGLFTGYLFATQGWRVRINERHSEIREIGAGLYMKNNAVTLLEHVGIADGILNRAVRLRRAEIRDHKDRLLQRRVLAGSTRAFNVPRSDVVVGLAQAARNAGASVVTNACVTKVDPKGLVVLAGGEVRAADLVVVASGFNSEFRDQLGLTVVARELANGATRMLVKRTKFEDEDITREWWSGRRRIGLAPTTSDLTNVYMSCPQSDRAGVALPTNTESWGRSFPMLRPVLQKLSDAVGATRYPYGYVRCSRWSKGRAALVGDAAHSMPPTLGQGAGCTLMNAYVLSQQMSQSNDIASGLALWERKIRPVIDATQKWGLRYDALTSNWPLWLSPVRHGVIWSFGRFRPLNARLRIADHIDVRVGAK